MINDDYGLKKQQGVTDVSVWNITYQWNAGKLEAFTQKKVLLFRVYSRKAQIRFVLLDKLNSTVSDACPTILRN